MSCQIRKELGDHRSADVRHDHNVSIFLGFAAHVQMHRCEGILVDNGVAGILEIDRISNTIGSARLEPWEACLQFVEQVSRIAQYPLFVFGLFGSRRDGREVIEHSWFDGIT